MAMRPFAARRRQPQPRGQCIGAPLASASMKLARPALIALSASVVGVPAQGAPPAAKSRVAAQALLIDLKPDLKTGKIIATLPKPGADGIAGRFIYLTQIETGLGSASLGFDRGASSG